MCFSICIRIIEFSNWIFWTRIKKVKNLIYFGVKKTGNKILQFFAIFNEILHFLA